MTDQHPSTASTPSGSAPAKVDRRTFLRATAIPIAAAAALAGADRAGAAPKRVPAVLRSGLASTKTVQMWSQAYGDPKTYGAFINDTIAAFKTKTGIDVKWEVIPWASALQKWDLVMSNGQLPDVADIFYLQSRVIQGQGKWGPLDITDEVAKGTFGDWNRFVPVGQLEAKYKDRIYGVPWRIDIRGFVYNADLWPTPPDDLTAFETMGKQVLAKGVQAASQTFGGASHAITQLSATWDVPVLSPDYTKSNLSDPRWLDALTWAQKMVNERILLANAITDARFPPYDALLNGTVASHFGGQSAILAVAKANAPAMVEKLKAALMPKGPAGKHQSIASTAQFVVFQNTSAKDESLAWLQYLTSSEVAAKLTDASGMDSPDVNVQKTKTDPFLQTMYEQSRQSRTIDDPTPAWTELSSSADSPLPKLAITVWSGGDVKAVNDILSKAGS